MNNKMKIRTLATEASKVKAYLTEYNNMLVGIVRSKGITKKETKWLKECIVSIMRTQSILDIAIAYNNVMEKYPLAQRKRMVKVLAEYTREHK